MTNNEIIDMPEKKIPQLQLESITDCSIILIKKNVESKHPILSYEKELIRRISSLEPNKQSREARDYFLGDFSTPILAYVSTKIYHHSNWEEILGEYYEFISKENKETKTPYYKVTLYNQLKNSTLRKYVTVITTRYFVDEKVRDEKITERTISLDGSSTYNEDKYGNVVIENPWFNLLIGNDGHNEGYDITPDVYQKIDYVFSKLPERDVKVIKLMVMNSLSGLEAFEEMRFYLSKGAKTPVNTWTNKQKQDAMALLRARALKHFNNIVENEKIDIR